MDKKELIISGVKHIKNEAYAYNEEITSIIIEEGVESIGKQSFYFCTNVKSIALPSTLKKIGDHAFDLEKLEDIYFNGTIAQWCRLSFDELPNLTFHGKNLYIQGKLIEGELVIPSEVTCIGKNAFSFYDKLTSVVISEGVKEVGDNAFSSCSRLERVTIPSSVEKIGYCSFNVLKSIKAIEVDENNQHYKSIEGSLYTKDGKILITYCAEKHGEHFDIPEGVTEIGGFAFSENQTVKSVTAPSSLITIGGCAFFSSRIAKFEFAADSHMTTIDFGAFSSCFLSSIDIPEGTIKIGDEAFCTSPLEEIIIPATMETIGEEAFDYCDIKEVYYTGTEEQWRKIIIELSDEYYFGDEERENPPMAKYNLFKGSTVHFNHKRK